MIHRLAAAAAVGLIGALALAGTAHAQDGVLPQAPWSANGETTVVDSTMVRLQDHATGDTSIETGNVSINVGAGATVSVDYQLVDDEAGEALCQAGEPRLFAVTNGTLDKTSLCDGAGDDAAEGTLTLETSSAGLVTHVGLVYSRDTGHVLMSDLTVDGQLIYFAEPESKPDPTPTAEPTVKPTVEPTAEPTAEPTTEPTDDPGAGGGELPKTSGLVAPVALAGGAVGLGSLGGLALWLARRRGVSVG